MTVTRPGQVEWEGLLFDIAPGGSDVWIPRGAKRTNWHPRRKRAVYETETGGVRGRPLWEPMFPAIDGVACDTADALLAVLSIMVPEYIVEPAPLVWWSFERDEILTAQAVPEQAIPVENDDSEHQTTRFVDVMWLVERPGEIDAGLEAESS